MNLLSLTATFGLLVRVFQDGHLHKRAGLRSDMVFAVLTDVLVVRILLGTADMNLLGRAARWAQGPLARFYNRFGVKETDLPTELADRSRQAGPVAAG